MPLAFWIVVSIVSAALLVTGLEVLAIRWLERRLQRDRPRGVDLAREYHLTP